MRREATLRATAESGDTIDDPSEDALFMMFEDIEAGHGTFLIVESLVDRSGQTYAQSSRNDDGTYVVEHRDGRPDRHFGTTVADMRIAHGVVTGWAFHLPEWDKLATWMPVSI